MDATPHLRGDSGMKVKGRQCDLCHRMLKPGKVAYKVSYGNSGDCLSWEKLDICAPCWGAIIRGMNRRRIDIEKNGTSSQI